MNSIPYVCADCGASTASAREAISYYELAVDEVRQEPWADHEIEFVCDCGSVVEEETFFAQAWDNATLRKDILQWAHAHLDVFRDDSWSYGGWILPPAAELAALDIELFSIYLAIVANTDVEHAHDDLYELHSTLTVLRQSNPERAWVVEQALRGRGSRIVNELLDT